MKKLSLLVVLGVIMVAQVSYATTYSWSCDFEQNETVDYWGPNVGEPAYNVGTLQPHGTRNWGSGWFDACGDCVVTDNDAFSGTQSIYMAGHQEASAMADQMDVPEYFEFAFKTMFNEGHGADAYVQARTIETIYYGNWGVHMKVYRNGDLTVRGMEAGSEVSAEKVVANVANEVWNTVSFRHHVVEWPEESGQFVYNGVYDVYVNGSLVEADFASFSTTAYSNLGAFNFASGNSSWGSLEGAWYVDAINASDTSNFVPEPATMTLLAIGLGAMLRRRK